ncbi:hypothetical protein SCB49_03074 [unidentified eubacterium SCB49]|nr:hypothetical protein SCB49_03074 [unidentified eubacterium SCB49]
MENPENLLQSIKKVQPDPELYATIRQRIRDREKETTPWNILKIAAILCGVLLCIEAYIVIAPSSIETDDTIALVSENTNTLYNDNE